MSHSKTAEELEIEMLEMLAQTSRLEKLSERLEKCNPSTKERHEDE